MSNTYAAKDVMLRIDGKKYGADKVTIDRVECACHSEGVDGLYCTECNRPHPVPSDLAALVEDSACTPRTDWIESCHVLADALLERGIMQPLCARRSKGAPERKALKLANIAFKWARRVLGFKPSIRPPWLINGDFPFPTSIRMMDDAWRNPDSISRLDFEFEPARFDARSLIATPARHLMAKIKI